jgi:caffeoyl-CoA O-methyltransferase
VDPRSSQRDGLNPRGRGGDIVYPRIEEYLEGLETTRDGVLLEMERQATERDFPIVGPLVGRTLCLLARSIGARPEDGELILTEMSPRNSTQARAFFQQAGIRCRHQFIVGDAFEAIDRLPGEFDIIFNDVDKQQYPAAFHKAVPRVRRGGYFLSDNMLWGGRVVDDPQHPTTQGVLQLTRLLFQAPDLYTTILPLRDGLSISLKLE